MTTKNDGGSAFPLVAEGHEHVLSIGLTARDYFAAKTMQGLVAGFVNVLHNDRRDFIKNIAPVAYDIADAMLAAREA